MMTLMKRTSLFLVPFAFCAIGISAFIFAGCSREEAKESPSAVPSAAATGRMQDATYVKTLTADRTRYVELVRDRNAIADKMRAMVEAKKAELKTDDLSKVKAVLDKDPAYQALYAECEKANARVERQRQETLKDVREKLNEGSRTGGQAAAPASKAGSVPQAASPLKAISK